MSTGVMMKKKRLFWNTIVPVVQQALQLYVAFLYHVIAKATLALKLMVWLHLSHNFISNCVYEMGVSAVVQTTLYKTVGRK